MEHADDEVLVEVRGALGHLVLNRPQVMNALTRTMVLTISRALDEWEHDDSVETVLLTGAGERGLCAGGDIVGMYHDALAGGDGSRAFWRDEYRLNARIARYPKPYVAVMDGVVLGGGIGVSAHGNARIVTERTRFGMPEVGIGFAPDVGGAWLLSRAPGELGTHLGLTGGMGSGADAVALGFADHYVPSDWLPALATALETTPAASAIAAVATEPPASALLAQRQWIDDCYSADDPVSIVERLSASTNPDARAAASVILTKSPTGVSVTLEAVRRAGRMSSLENVLDQDYRVSTTFLAGTELIEGIRAQVIDKDRMPRWNPASLSEVSRSDIDVYFADRGAEELGLSARAGQE
ncbi:enoyl-CoA hydratase [Cryobacterium mesophilum]|uniref:3-hydroxyisobutyryl-CoA hydrolase n=1 Tax=Terrimesophilobacter mesophilus TaxID=433647 RepID=A0A4R8V8Q9_9MICO|nr:enoyl-CoA hydratase/isomerase family protein [Terrimesophilobacter mesophilus]MBB5632712.1 enoyl-CoA hydratase [Terrimesophilobacter mesophilus]TFB79514.1 enoyl-CoA hydratase/isomerase family protein [Terrimesophilobacter mesophilus]